MSVAEVGFRLVQAVRTQVRRCYAGRTFDAQDVDRVRPARNPRPRAFRFFDIDLEYPAALPLDWARDYKNGVSAPRRFYATVDYRDSAQVGDSKYTWELNRHQFLVPWALDYAASRDEDHAAAVVGVILDWIADNPRYQGVNWISSLEHALRILSWGIALDLCRDSALVQRARPLIAASVDQQAHFIRWTLSLHSSANNHLTGELTGLLAAAAYFPEAPRAAAYARFAGRRLLREAVAQNLTDGVNREQAIYYHHYALEYLLTSFCLFERLGWPVPSPLHGLTRRMLDFVDAVTDDYGMPFEIGDRDDGTVTGLNHGTRVGVFESLLWSGYLLYGDDALGSHAARIARNRGDEPAIDRRNAYWYAVTSPPAALDLLGRTVVPRRVFPKGGYFLSRDGSASLAFKAGPFGYPSIAAHAHCDQLSVGLKRGGLDVLTDAGTYVYHTEDRWRRFFKGTAAHNTVRVDGRDQAEYAGPFLWASHAEAELQVLRNEPAAFDVEGVHHGYERLADPVRHVRRVAYREGLGYRITDSLSGTRPHLFELFWNLGPGVRPVSIASVASKLPTACAWRLEREGEALLALVVVGDTPSRVDLAHGDEETPAGFQSRTYLERVPIHSIRLEVSAPRCELRTYLLPPAPDLGVVDPALLEEAWS